MAAAQLLLGEGAMRVPGRGACSPGDGGGAHGSQGARAHQQWRRLGNGGERRLQGNFKGAQLGFWGWPSILGVRVHSGTRGVNRAHARRGERAGARGVLGRAGASRRRRLGVWEPGGAPLLGQGGGATRLGRVGRLAGGQTGPWRARAGGKGNGGSWPSMRLGWLRGPEGGGERKKKREV